MVDSCDAFFLLTFTALEGNIPLTTRFHAYLILSCTLFACEQLLDSMVYMQVIQLCDRGLQLLEKMQQHHAISKSPLEVFPFTRFRLHLLLKKQQSLLLLGEVQSTQPVFEEIKASTT